MKLKLILILITIIGVAPAVFCGVLSQLGGVSVGVKWPERIGRQSQADQANDRNAILEFSGSRWPSLVIFAGALLIIVGINFLFELRGP